MAETISTRKLIKLLTEEREGYRGVAFPKGGSKTIRTRDQQNAALVARGGVHACDRLIEILRGACR